MRRSRNLYLIIPATLVLNIILITVCTGLIEGSWWKYSRGAYFKDTMEFDEKLQARSILISKEGKTEKIILLYLFDYMIISDANLTNWTYYVRKGRKSDP